MINKHIQRLRTAENGFDLVQALVVVVILGALATIAALTLLGEAGKGEAASVKADTASAVSTAKRFQAEDGGTSWATGIAAEITAEVPSATVTGATGTGNMTITINNRDNYVCEATVPISGGAVTYGVPTGSSKAEACPA